MTNLYLSKAASTYFGYEIFDGISPEVAMWHWFVHIFEINGKQHLILIEEQSLYSVVIFGIVNDFNICGNEFLKQCEKQMRSDKFTDDEIRLALGIAQTVGVYGMPFKGREMTMVTHMVRKIKSKFEETRDSAKVKDFAERILNGIPWKILGYKTPVEQFKRQVRRL